MSEMRCAIVFRMVFPDRVCPLGVRAKQLLEDAGFDVDDRPLESRSQVEAFKAEHGVLTTPQVFIGSRKIGGNDELERYLIEE